MPVMVPGGVAAGPFLPAVPVPPGDPEVLGRLAGTFSAGAASVSGAADRVARTGASPGWQGLGADAYRGKAEAVAAVYRAVRSGLEHASAAYAAYARDLAHAQAVARRAQGLVDEANATASAMLSAQAAAAQAAGQAQAAAQAASDAAARAAAPHAAAGAQALADQLAGQADQASGAAGQAAAHAQYLEGLYAAQRSQALAAAAEAEVLATSAATRASAAFAAVAGELSVTPPARGRPAHGVPGESLSQRVGALNTELGYGVSPWALLTAPPAAVAAIRYLKALADLRSLPQTFGVMRRFFGEELVPTAEAMGATNAARYFESAEPTYELLFGYAVGRQASAARRAFGDLGGLPDNALFAWGSRVLGGAAIVGDVATLWNPGGASAGENVANRVAAGGNLVGTASVMAGSDGLASAAGLVGLNVSTDWIPVAGQAVAIGTGLYLAGDWAYHTIKPFHDFVNAAGHTIGTAADDTGHFFSHDVGHFVSHDMFGWL